MKAFDHLAWRALVRLAGNEPVDPNDPDIWESRDEQAQAVLRRHGLTNLKAGRLTLAAVNALVDGQRTADDDAGLDWGTLTVPASRLDEPLRRAHARLPIDLSDPAVYLHRDDQRRVLAGRLGLAADKADDLSRWALAYPDEFDPDDLRCWRIGSTTWLALADEQLETIERGAAAGGPVRRTGDQNGGLAAEPGAVTRRDPSGRDARRPSRSRPVRGDTPVRPGAGAARAAQPADAARGAQGVPGLRRAARVGAVGKAGPACEPRGAARQAGPVGPAGGVADRLHGQRRHAQVGAAPAGGDLSDPRLHTASARRQTHEREVQRPAQRGHGPRRGRADRGRTRAAATALHRGGRTPEGQNPRGADEGPPRRPDHHHLRRPQRHHPPPGGRAGDPRAASAQARRERRSRSTPAPGRWCG